MDQCGNFGLQRGDVLCKGSRSPPHVVVEIPPDQQEEQQHNGGFEIGMMLVLDGLDDRQGDRQCHADHDRHIHVQPAGSQGVEGAAKERPPGVGNRRQGNQRRQPVEEIPGFRGDVGGIARPHGNGQQHDVHTGKAGNRQAAQQLFAGLVLTLLLACRIKRVGLVSETFQLGDDLVSPGLVFRPVDGEPLAGQVDACRPDARKPFQTSLDVSHAGSAGDAVDGKVHVDRTVFARRHECLPITLMDRHGTCLSS